MDIQNSGFQYQFTRHLASCNNIESGKLFGKDFEPSSTIYGIIKTIQFSQGNSESYQFSHIYVSNLIRTWITAVLLYGTHNSQELTLYISPFLKEKHDSFGLLEVKRGNFPKEIYHTAKKFEKFLLTLHDLCDDNMLSQDQKSVLDQVGFSKDYYSKLPGKITLVLPEKTDGSKQQIVFEKTENGYKIESDVCLVEDTAGPSTKKEGFTTTGDLQKFMEWFESTNNYHGQNHENGLVHVVTHSQIMQKYLRDKFNFDIDKIKDYSKVRHSNSWRFKTRTVIQPNELVNMKKDGIDTQNKVPELVPGVPLDKEMAKGLEDHLENLSLCGAMGSVESITCGRNGGAKKTRKNRINKTQKNKNRKMKTAKK
jgi:hypothetical protein